MPDYPLADMTRRDDLADRVTQFNLMELPGQPRMMHMGTSYLVNDLWRALREAREEDLGLPTASAQGSSPIALEREEGKNRYRKKPVVIEATQWFKNGDHPLDHPQDEMPDWEGRIVRYYRHPDVPGTSRCKHEHCQRQMHDHGWIDTLEGGHVVCPGDWIITGVKGEFYPCKPDIFAATYEPASTSSGASPIAEPPCGAGVITLFPSDYASLLACREILKEARQTLATLHEIAAMMSEDNWRDRKTDIERHASYRFDSVSAALSASERQGDEQ